MSDTTTNQPEGWRPSDGATVSGPIVELNAGWSDYHQSNYPIVVIEDRNQDGKLVAVHAFHQVLWRRLAQLKPKTGETLTITYHGQKDSKDGKRKVSLYSANIEGRDVGLDWNSMQPPGGGQPVVTQQDFQLPTGDPEDVEPF